MRVNLLARKLKKISDGRMPDERIHAERDYIQRWHIIPKNRFLNIFLHRVNANDDDRALHDHPWSSCSIILDGSYKEIMPDRTAIRNKGNVTFRSGKAMHRLEVNEGPVWSLFITGPKYRQWGFDDPVDGWTHNKDYPDPWEFQQFGESCKHIRS